MVISSLVLKLDRVILIVNILNILNGGHMINAIVSSPRVMTKYGEIQGSQLEVNGTTIRTYLGVPYAQPPTGTRRFKKPSPALSWSGVRSAKTYAAACVQPDLFSPSPGVTGEEDCLYLNIYTPYNGQIAGKLLPVMVWIHGGGFVLGTGSTFSGSLLASQGVVIVTINYRLGVLGFLSTEDDVMPGNFGMMDQIQALKWLQENIASFGGDSDDVTVFGQSAGSASVSLLMLSPLAQGLFHKGIMESGGSLFPGAIAQQSDMISPVVFANKLSSGVGCNQSNSLLTLQCLQGIDSVALVKTSNRIVFSLRGFVPFKPRMETTFGFLPDQPVDILRKGNFSNIATLRGFNGQEFGNAVSDAQDDGITMQEFDETVRRILPNVYDFYKNQTSLFNDLYQIDNSGPFQLRSGLVQLLTDISFVAPTIQEIETIISIYPTSNHFLYRFTYTASYIQTPKWVGVVHMAELPFVFGISSSLVNQLGLAQNVTITNDDALINYEIMIMWTNFAKYGNPTPNPIANVVWKPYHAINGERNILQVECPLKHYSYERQRLLAIFSWYLNDI